MASSRVDRHDVGAGARPRRPRLDSLTGLRFLAALAVFGNHAGDQLLAGSQSVAAESLQTGRAGVSFFFVLSGFVLTWSATTADGARPFYRRRFARVVPNHVVAWLLAFGVLLLESTRPGAVGAILSLLLLQAWAPSSSIHFAVNPVAWTLSCEMLFYATFPVLLTMARRVPANLRVLLVAGLVLAPFAAAAFARIAFADDVAEWFVYVFPLARLPEFVIGILLALEVADRRWPTIPLAGAAVLVIGVGPTLAYAPSVLQPVAVMLIPFILLIVAAAQADLEGQRSVFRGRSLVILGQWSFAFYLLHELVLRTAGNAADFGRWETLPKAFAAAALLVVAVGASALMFRLVERPAEARLRQGAAPPAHAVSTGVR